MKRFKNILLLGLLALVASLSFGADVPPEFTKHVVPFIKEHCIDCHGPDVQKAKLRLDTLAPDFSTKESAAVWVHVLDKVVEGKMPPPKEARPPKVQQDAALAVLNTQLREASLKRQQTEGRVLLRRLNRNEYENTLRDLLQMKIDVDDLFPDDNFVAGFDNVSEGLDLSSAHLLRYQDAAEKVLSEAIPYRPVLSKTERMTGAKFSDGKNKSLEKEIGANVKIDGDSLITYARQQRYVGFSTPSSHMKGRFKFRLCGQALNTGGKSIPVQFNYFTNLTRDEGEVRACLDMPSEKSSVVEFETELNAREHLVFNGWSLPTSGDFKRQFKEGLAAPGASDAPALRIEWIEIEGPINPFPGPSYQTLFADVPLKAKTVIAAEAKKQKPPVIANSRNDYQWMADRLISDSAESKKDAERLITGFVSKAARRPMPKDVLDYFIQYANKRIDEGVPFQDVMLSTYKAVLCSSYFLILNEQPGKLDDYALASRLSYFLWRSMPDATLLVLAAKGELSKKEVIHAQVERLLKDPKSQRFVEDFTNQWLELRKINATSPDPKLYAEFDQYLLWSMPRETRAFFSEVLEKDLSVANFIQSDWTFVNERLAQHYGIKDVVGSGVRKVSLTPDLHRGGVLTHSSVLKVTADGTRTSPIIRGKWVLEHILGKPPSPPPPDVPAIEPDIRGATTIRQQLEKHRNTPACASCHQYIDPPGFALESFDVIGEWRDFYRLANGKQVEVPNYPNRKVSKGPLVEKGDKTPDGKVFNDIDDYKKILLDDREQIVRNLVQKLMIHATGADIQFADREVVEQIVADAHKKDDGLRTIIHAITESRVFLNK